MAENKDPQGQKDSLEELGERVKEKIAAGMGLFDYVVKPKAKEVLENVRGAVEGGLNKVRDSLDPTRGLERSSREVRDWFVAKGLSAKDANEMVIRTVTSALKTKKEKKND